MSRQFNFSLYETFRRNKEGSFSTQAARQNILKVAMNQLQEMKCDLHSVKNLKPKHINLLVERWKNESLSPGTIKNRMSHLRWLAEKIGKPNIVERANSDYNIEQRVAKPNSKNIAQRLNQSVLERISDINIKLAVELQEKFGLRREEAIKFDVRFSDRNGFLKVESTFNEKELKQLEKIGVVKGTKGGLYRDIPVRTSEQRDLLDRIRAHVRLNHQTTLIPTDKSYKQQLKRYEYQTHRVGLRKLHGLRHEYAQQRYRELTGWESPKNGGPMKRDMTERQFLQDRESRLEISGELGHRRLDVTVSYLGSNSRRS